MDKDQRIFYKKVKRTYRSYLQNKSNSLHIFDIADLTFDEEIICIYDQMRRSNDKRFEKDVSDYEQFIVAASEHNKTVRRIRQFVDNWNIELFLDGIDSINEEVIKEIDSMRAAIQKFDKPYDDKTKRFLSDVAKLKANTKKINRVLSKLDDYRTIADLSKYNYIDSKQKNEITGQILHCLSSKKKIRLKFYDPNNHAHIIKLIEKHNRDCVDRLSNNPIFDDVNGISLDMEQRKSIVANEQSVLVVAGAGSGKTLTICGKIKYLLEDQNVQPEDILLLSYSKKSADDLQKKVSKINANLKVGTFHKIGLEILKQSLHKTFMVEDQYKAIIEKYFSDEMHNRPLIMQKILTYYGLYISSEKHKKQYKDTGEMYVDLKNSDFVTLKNQLLSLTDNIIERETIKKELVKSFEEMAIANWYFLNGIDYIYEAPYKVNVSTIDKRQYMPDFKLEKYPIYHEHYGINRQGKAAQFEGQEAIDYVNGMKWKRNIHTLYSTDCIETYSYEFSDGIVFDKLEEELKKRGVKFNPLTNEQIFNALHSIYEKKSFKSFINLIRTFLSLYKATYRDDSAFELLANSEFRSAYERRRAKLFLEIVKDIYLYYKDYLESEGKIDFDDMILQSIVELDNLETFNYKYIIVDEFQDISISRMKFLKRLIQQGNSKLFAVGDDWQAIYRFSGCDLNIFLNFEKYFGSSAITTISKTHRNSQELQDIVGPFIKKNPEQIKKVIHSESHLSDPIQVMYYIDSKCAAFLKVLREIARKDSCASVLVLGRNNKDFEDIANDKYVQINFKDSDEVNTIIRCPVFPHLKLRYSTVHGSKGLEDDYVILINADDNRIGFPNKMEDDELLDLVLSNKSEFEYAEERRLWYVAMTRTKNCTYIIANKEKPSIFLQEMLEHCFVMDDKDVDDSNKTNITCPHCKSGKLVLRTNESEDSTFYGCSNYPYCSYTINDLKAVENNKRCRNCGDFMVKRKNKNGSVFYGCHNYPRCDYTEEYKQKR